MTFWIPKATLAKPGGWLRVMDHMTGKVTEQDTITCCHCNSVVFFEKGKELGFCKSCDHLTCEKAECKEHYSFKQKLDDYENGILLELK